MQKKKADKNINGDITLNQIAKIACFSPFHFHRIFSTLTNETINSFIQRKRIEKAAQQLRIEENVSISEIAYNFIRNQFIKLSN